jgi:hypothetical protein
LPRMLRSASASAATWVSMIKSALEILRADRAAHDKTISLRRCDLFDTNLIRILLTLLVLFDILNRTINLPVLPSLCLAPVRLHGWYLYHIHC